MNFITEYSYCEFALNLAQSQRKNKQCSQNKAQPLVDDVQTKATKQNTRSLKPNWQKK